MRMKSGKVFLGNIHDSFFWCIISIYAVYGCKILESTLKLRKLAVEHVKKGILNIKLKDSHFENQHMKYRQFLTKFEAEQHNIDRHFILAPALASASHMPYIFMSILKMLEDNPMFFFKFNTRCLKTAFTFGVLKLEGEMLFQPYFYTKNLEFSLESIKRKVQIFAYLAKSEWENVENRTILDFEVFSILVSLRAYQDTYQTPDAVY